jgi:uncharacterized alkaline shock family protein YloU
MSEAHVLRNPAGSITIPAGTLDTIVQRAAESVRPARVRRRRRGVDVSVENGSVKVELSISAPYGTVLPDLAHAVQERVASSLGAMCGLEVTAVDVTVEELVRT